jgi:hypothetical protein
MSATRCCHQIRHNPIQGDIQAQWDHLDIRQSIRYAGGQQCIADDFYLFHHLAEL